MKRIYDHHNIILINHKIITHDHDHINTEKIEIQKQNLSRYKNHTVHEQQPHWIHVHKTMIDDHNIPTKLHGELHEKHNIKSSTLIVTGKQIGRAHV